MIEIHKHTKQNKLIAFIVGLVVLVVSIPAVFTLRFPGKVEAAWFDDSYTYRHKVTFTHNADISSNRSITMTLDTAELIAANLMQSNCRDVRFTDSNGKLLPFQLTGSCDNASTTYEVLFPQIVNGSNLFYTYYGNPSALYTSDPTVQNAALLTPSGGDPSETDPTTDGSQEQGPGPISYWNFDEAQGSTANDVSTGSNNDLTITNALWRTPDQCVSGPCLYLDGNADRATKSYSSDTELLPGTGSFAVSAWLKHTSTAGADTAISRVDAVNGVGWKIYMDSSGFICFGIDQTAGSFPVDSACSTTSYADSKWHFVTAVKSTTSSITLYIDGNQIAQDASITATTIDGTNAPFTVGNDFDNGTNGWSGFIDEVKYYNFAKTASQITTEFNSRSAPKGVAAQFGPDTNKALSQGLVGYWKMDESAANSCTGGTNDSCDFSGNANDGAWNGNAANTTGKFGNGVTHDGAGDWTEVADSTSLDTITTTNTYTIAMWVKPNQNYEEEADGWYYMAERDGAEAFQLQIGYGGWGDTLGFSVGSNIGSYCDVGEPADSYLTSGVWYHVVGVFDDKNKVVNIFRNGVITGTAACDVTLTTGGATLRFGGQPASRYFNGVFDEVRLYNRALSAGEIGQLADSAPGPVGWWKLDETSWNNDCSTDTVVDSSGNSYSGDSCPSSTGPTTPLTGKYGRAGSFDGSNDRVDITSSFQIPSLQGTVSLWIYPKASGIYDIASSGVNLNDFRLSPGNNFYGFFISSEYRVSYSTDPTANTWTHLTLTWDQTNGSILYFNAIRVASNSSPPPAYNQTGFKLGSRPDSVSEFFTGLLDDVRVYNYPRTPEQIIEDMNAGHPAGGSPVGSQIIHWRFDEQQGSTANNANSVQSALTGTTSGTAWLLANNCKINGCQYVDTNSDSVSAGDLAFIDSLTGLSLSIWMNPQTITVDDDIISKSDLTSTNTVFHVRTDATNSDEIRVYIGDNTDITDYFTTTNFDLITSSWQHLMVVYDGTQAAADRVKVYKNGRRVSGSVTGTIPATLDSSSTAAMRLGDSDSSGSNGLLSYHDELKIYNAALSASDSLIDANAGAAVNYGGVLDNNDNEGFAGNPPVGWWKLDEGSGLSAYDSSGNSNTGTLVASSEWKAGYTSSGVSFNGTDNYIQVPDSSLYEGLTAITVCAYAYPRRTPPVDSDTIVTKPVHAPNTATSDPFSLWDLFINTDNTVGWAISTGISGSRKTVASSQTLTPRKWYHICGLYDGAEIRTYIDGVRDANATATTLTIGTNARDVLIGAFMSTGGFNDVIDGTIDDVRIYNYALTDGQIRYAFSRGAPIAHYRFDECQGATAYNTARNANNDPAGMNGTITPVTLGNTAVGICNGVSTDMWDDGTTGKRNSSIGLDGSDDYVEIADTSSLRFDASSRDFSIFSWVKRNASGAIHYIASKEDADNDGWRLQFNATNTVTCSVDAIDITSTSTITDTNWHHIGCVIDRDGTGQIYIDGRIDGSAVAISSEVMATTSNIRIGTRSYTSTSYLNGLVDDVRIYPYALSGDDGAAWVKSITNESAQRFGPSTGSP